MRNYYLRTKEGTMFLLSQEFPLTCQINDDFCKVGELYEYNILGKITKMEVIATSGRAVIVKIAEVVE